MPAASAYTYLLATLGERDADLLWPHIEWAETARLVRVYGYARDNALPPPLAERLRDEAFIDDLRASLEEASDEALEVLGRLLLV